MPIKDLSQKNRQLTMKLIQLAEVILYFPVDRNMNNMFSGV